MLVTHLLTVIFILFWFLESSARESKSAAMQINSIVRWIFSSMEVVSPGNIAETVFGLVYIGISKCCSRGVSVSRSMASRVGSNNVNKDCASSSPTSLELKFPWVLKMKREREKCWRMHVEKHVYRLEIKRCLYSIHCFTFICQLPKRVT